MIPSLAKSTHYYEASMPACPSDSPSARPPARLLHKPSCHSASQNVRQLEIELGSSLAPSQAWQPIRQSINQPINQSAPHLVSESINHSINQPINQSASQSSNQSISQPIKQSVNQSANQPASAYKQACSLYSSCSPAAPTAARHSITARPQLIVAINCPMRLRCLES